VAIQQAPKLRIELVCSLYVPPHIGPCIKRVAAAADRVLFCSVLVWSGLVWSGLICSGLVCSGWVVFSMRTIQVGHVSMKRDGVFHTWIDYPKFHELTASGEHFTAADYMAPTPDWAAFNPVRSRPALYSSGAVQSEHVLDRIA
jgi:hypothetical protein